MPRSTAPVARYQARNPSELVVARSVSERTVEDSENAMAARAAESHSTAKSALPRSRRLLLVDIDRRHLTTHVNGNMQRRDGQPRWIKLTRRHFHANCGRQNRTIPDQDPIPLIQSIRNCFVINKAAVGQLLCQNCASIRLRRKKVTGTAWRGGSRAVVNQ